MRHIRRRRPIRQLHPAHAHRKAAPQLVQPRLRVDALLVVGLLVVVANACVRTRRRRLAIDRLALDRRSRSRIRCIRLDLALDAALGHPAGQQGDVHRQHGQVQRARGVATTRVQAAVAGGGGLAAARPLRRRRLRALRVHSADIAAAGQLRVIRLVSERRR